MAILNKNGGSPIRMRLLRGIGANFFSQIVVLTVQFGLVPIMAQSWGIETYGMWLLLFSIPAYLSLGEFGLMSAAQTRMTMEAARGDKAAAIATFHSACSASLFLTTFFAIIGVALILAASFVNRSVIITNDLRSTLLFLLFYGLLCLQSPLVQAGFRSSGAYSVGVALQSCAMLIEAVAAAVMIGLGFGMSVVAASYFVCRTLMLAVQFLVLRRCASWIDIGLNNASIDIIQQLVRPAIAIMALPVAYAIVLQGMPLVVGMFISVAAVAIFTTVRTLTRSVLQATLLVNHAVMPELTMAVARLDGRAIDRMIRFTLINSFVVAIPSTIGIILLGPWFINIWTHGVVQPSQFFIAVMALTTTLAAVWNPLSNLIIAVNRHARYTYTFLGASVAALALAVPASMVLGEIGVGLSLIALDVFMLQHTLRLVFFERILQENLNDANLSAAAPI